MGIAVVFPPFSQLRLWRACNRPKTGSLWLRVEDAGLIEITHFVSNISNSLVGSDLLHNESFLLPKIMFRIQMSNNMLCLLFF